VSTRDWIASTVGEATFAQLAEQLPGSELQSLLLEVMRERARVRTPAEVLAQYRRDRFVSPSGIDLRTQLAVDGELLAAAGEFEAIELSPLAPLATCSSMALTDQHRTVAALRGTEVVSDPTNVLALECARRLHAGDVHLTTSQRVVRAQPVPNKPGFAQHFRLFVLASAGRERADHGFSHAMLVRHIRTMLAGLDRLEARGYRFGARRVDVLATTERSGLADRVAADVGGARKPLDHAYYSGGIRYMLWTTTRDGTELPLADGGLFDWVATLTSNRRNVYVASGLGAQLVPSAFTR
jgi:hypothetical protein